MHGHDSREFTQRNMIVVPVVDNDERLIGAVPPEALFRILRDEHMEDIQRLAGSTFPREPTYRYTLRDT